MLRCAVARLFFALTLPPNISDTLDSMCEGVPNARWALENEFHITLSFLGDVPMSLMREVHEVANSIRIAPFRLALEEVGVFPHRGTPRIVWVGVRRDDGLMNLQRVLQSELRHLGFTFEKRKYHPHVTLARMESGPREPLTEWIGQHLHLRSPEFMVSQFHLVSSILRPTGSRYTVESSYRLRTLA